MNIKKLTSLLFHRTVLVGVMILLQVLVLLVAMLEFTSYFVYFYWFSVVLSAGVVLYVVNKKMEPGYKISWIITILLLPIFGGLVYLLFGGNQLSARMRRKMQGMDQRLIELLDEDCKAECLDRFGADAVNQARYVERYAHCPVYTNTATEYFSLGELAFPRILEELRRAEHYIFIEYFIIEPGLFWDSILEILKEKHTAGVDVRVIYDDVGSLYTLPMNFAHHFEEETGIPCCVFNRFRPVLSIRMNNRDHRKFLIIDGHTAFTGGINLADEYINNKVKYGHWKDCALLLKGEAVWSMAVVFLTMWEYIREVAEDYDTFRPTILPPESALGAGFFVQPYVDNPLDNEAVGETVYLNLINKAQRYVYIATPYLIIGDSVSNALCNAAKAGVDVRILTPHIPDKKIVFELTRAHYEALLEAGVRIYEYTPGFVHGKTFAVDDIYGTVGTVNMDYRSMYLHFENGVWLCHDPTILSIKDDFLQTLEHSQAVTLAQCTDQPALRKLLRAVLRVFAPLL